MSLRSLTLSLMLGSLATVPLAAAADAQEIPGQRSDVEATGEPAGKGFPIAPVHESETRRERTAEDIARERIWRREYQAFLDAKLSRANGKLGAGLLLTVAGGFSLIAGLVVAIVRFVDMITYPSMNSNPGHDDGGSAIPIALPVSLVCGGAAGLAVGLPLLLSGALEARRVERMHLLLDLERKAAARPVSSVELSVSAVAGPHAVQIQIAIAL